MYLQLILSAYNGYKKRSYVQVGFFLSQDIILLQVETRILRIISASVRAF